MTSDSDSNEKRFAASELNSFLEMKIPIVFKFRETLTPETDRGCALMAAAFLDAQLEELFRKTWVDDPKALDEILGQTKPLGTFSARIDVAFLCGLINEKTKRDLHLIRKIRNDFGHEPAPISFATGKIASRCRELYHTYRGKDDGPRSLFTSATLGVLAMIHVAAHKVTKAGPAEDFEITHEAR
ncbi:MAG: hypothetical protein WA624_08070, partial [Methylocella sp.]